MRSRLARKPPLVARIERIYAAANMWKLESYEHRVDVLKFVDIAKAVGVDPLDLLRRVL